MSYLIDEQVGSSHLLMGNEAIVRGALEGGISVATGYPGTPSSEIIESLAGVSKERNLYVEWSINEKVALEVAAAASFAGLRSLCAMKQNGVNVTSDFLLHLASSGTRGGMVLVACDDPGALSSVNEGESRLFAKLVEIPLLEPGDFQEAKDLTKWAFELSEEIGNLVMIRSVTRMSHASGNVQYGRLPNNKARALFDCQGPLLDQKKGPMISMAVGAAELQHGPQQEKLRRAAEIFEECPFNTYNGPKNPELLIVTSSACNLYSKEAIQVLDAGEKVGILKLATTWPLPRNVIKSHLARTDRIMIVEEVLPTLEENIKVLAAEMACEVGIKKFYGKNSGHIPSIGEMNPDLVIEALSSILGLERPSISKAFAEKSGKILDKIVPTREMTFCPGCPHRASYWSIHNAIEMDGRQGFVCGDIGCYTLGMLPCGFSSLKTLHSMGSGSGIASGFGKLKQFGMEQPVIAVCGDSTFFHAAMPALANAVHQKSPFTLVILDNSGTAMTGFQVHPGIAANAMGEEMPALDITAICTSMGARVQKVDPFDLEETRRALNEMMEHREGAKVIILQQACALSPQRKGKKNYEVEIDEEMCLGEACGCNRICTRIFGCPGIVWNKEKGVSTIDELICVGCGVCADICPQGAIQRREAS